MNVSVAEFDWDDGNRDKCQNRARAQNSTYERRFIGIGRTTMGRYALVVFTPRDKAGETVLRPISARYMHIKEVARYEKEIASIQDR